MSSHWRVWTLRRTNPYRSVIFSVCKIVAFGHGPGTNEVNFGDDPDHRPDPGVRSPKSGFTGLSFYHYQRILMKFYGDHRELGRGLETN